MARGRGRPSSCRDEDTCVNNGILKDIRAASGVKGDSTRPANNDDSQYQAKEEVGNDDALRDRAVHRIGGGGCNYFGVVIKTKQKVEPEKFAKQQHGSEGLDMNSTAEDYTRILIQQAHVFAYLSQSPEGILGSPKGSAALALRSLSEMNSNEIADESASTLSHSLSELVKSTERKALLKLAKWCYGIQEVSPSDFEAHGDTIAQALVYAIDNPVGSKAITYEAMQAVIIMCKKTSKSRELSSVWMPSIYRRLLSADMRDREQAERCLMQVQSYILPPASCLSKVVAADITEILLLKMERMLKSRALIVPAINAWAWFIKLLGSQAGENKTLTNQMLKIMEVTFTSHDKQVQIASLDAWKALIESLLQYLMVSEPDDTGHILADRLHNSSVCQEKLLTSRSLKCLKLLVMPLTAIMSNARDQSVGLACWLTWSFLASKLGSAINDPLISNAVVAPMLEMLIKSGPDKGNPWVWDLCLNAIEDLIARKFSHKSEILLHQSSFAEIENKNLVLESPDSKPAENGKEGSFLTNWSPWSHPSLGLFLKLLRALWTCGLNNAKHSCSNNPSLTGALRLLVLLAKGLERDGKAAIKPSEQHVNSVHSLLRFFHDLLLGKTQVCSKLIDAEWSAVLALMKLGPLILSSSFYKLSLLQMGSHEREYQFFGTVSDAEKYTCSTELGWGCFVTPIVYITASWLQFEFEADHDGMEVDMIKRQEKLAVNVCAGLNFMADLLCIVRVLEWLLSKWFCDSGAIMETDERPFNSALVDAKPTDIKQSLQQHITFIFWSWKAFTECMVKCLEKADDMPSALGVIDDSGYQVIYSFLLFPLNTLLQCTTLSLHIEAESQHKCCINTVVEVAECYVHLEPVTNSWIKLFDCISCTSAAKSSESNIFGAGLCQRILKLLKQHCQENYVGAKPYFLEGCYLIKMLEITVTNILKQTEISSIGILALTRKKRFRSYRGSACMARAAAESDEDDSSNIKDILLLASRFLELAWGEISAGNVCCLAPTSRVFGALASFVECLHLQPDIIMFLEVFSTSLSKWLGDPESLLSCHSRKPFTTIIIPAVQKLWKALLSILQKCKPPLKFDSNMLSRQASLLLPALQHSQSCISECTLLFWEATYGSQAFLTYPSSLITVLYQLKVKEKISLPDGDKASDGVVGKLQPTASEPLNHTNAVSRHFKKPQKEFFGKERHSICASPSLEPSAHEASKQSEKLPVKGLQYSKQQIDQDHESRYDPALEDRQILLGLQESRQEPAAGSVEQINSGMSKKSKVLKTGLWHTGQIESATSSRFNGAVNTPVRTGERLCVEFDDRPEHGLVSLEEASLSGSNHKEILQSDAVYCESGFDLDLCAPASRKKQKLVANLTYLHEPTGQEMPHHLKEHEDVTQQELLKNRSSHYTPGAEDFTDAGMSQVPVSADEAATFGPKNGQPIQHSGDICAHTDFLPGDDNVSPNIVLPMMGCKTQTLAGDMESSQDAQYNIASQRKPVAKRVHGLTLSSGVHNQPKLYQIKGLGTQKEWFLSSSGFLKDGKHHSVFSKDTEDKFQSQNIGMSLCGNHGKLRDGSPNNTKVGFDIITEKQHHLNESRVSVATMSVDVNMGSDAISGYDTKDPATVQSETNDGLSAGEPGIPLSCSPEDDITNAVGKMETARNLNYRHFCQRTKIPRRGLKFDRQVKKLCVKQQRTRMLRRNPKLNREVKILGLRKQKFLRSSGCLRGGKFWRTASGAAGCLANFSNQCQSQIPGRTKVVGGTAAELSKGDAEGSPNAVVNGNVLSQNLDARDALQANCNLDSSNKGGTLLRHGELESSFRVRTLNRGLLVKLFSSIAKEAESIRCRSSCKSTYTAHKEKGRVFGRLHHRKSSFPKKIPLAEKLQQEGGCMKVKQRRKEAEKLLQWQSALLNLKSSTPSKTLRSGKKLKGFEIEEASQTCSFTCASADLRVKQTNIVNESDHSSGKFYEGVASLLHNKIETGHEFEEFRDLERGPVPSSSGDMVQNCKIGLDICGTRWAICDVLGAMAASSQWKNMELANLDCAQKLLSTLQGKIHESKKTLLDSSVQVE